MHQRDCTPDVDGMDVDGSQQHLVQHLASICVTILREPDDSNAPALECVVEQLRTVNCADTSCEAAMCASSIPVEACDAPQIALCTADTEGSNDHHIYDCVALVRTHLNCHQDIVWDLRVR